MDPEQLDTQFRRRFTASEPAIDEEALSRTVCDGLPAYGKRRAAKWGSGRTLRRGLVFGVATLAVLVALGFGVHTLIDRLGWGQNVVVITDDTASLGNVASGGDSSTTTVPSTLRGARAELWQEIQRIREGVEAGTLVLNWPAPGVAVGDLALGNLPSDPLKLLDSLEGSVLHPDVTLYLADAAGAAQALQSEIEALPEVSGLLFVSKEQAFAHLKEQFADNPEVLENLAGNPLPASIKIWLDDPEQAASLAERFAGRPEVDEVSHTGSFHMDYAAWTARLRSLTRSVGGSETSTT
jgi:hypothetical protein